MSGQTTKKNCTGTFCDCCCLVFDNTPTCNLFEGCLAVGGGSRRIASPLLFSDSSQEEVNGSLFLGKTQEDPLPKSSLSKFQIHSGEILSGLCQYCGLCIEDSFSHDERTCGASPPSYQPLLQVGMGLTSELQSTRATPLRETSSRKCSSCGVTFGSLKYLLNHEKSCREVSSSSSLLKCSKCERIFKNRKHLKAHEFRCTQPTCFKCGKPFTLLRNKTRHEIFCRGGLVECRKCGEKLSDLKLRLNHEVGCTAVYRGECSKCQQVFTNWYLHTSHEQNCGDAYASRQGEPSTRELASIRPNLDLVQEYESAYQGRIKSYFIRSNDNQSLSAFFDSVLDRVVELLRRGLVDHRALKVNFVVDCTFFNIHDERMEFNFKTFNTPVDMSTDLERFVRNQFTKMMSEMEEGQLQKSSWVLNGVDGLRIKVNKFQPLRG